MLRVLIVSRPRRGGKSGFASHERDRFQCCSQAPGAARSPRKTASEDVDDPQRCRSETRKPYARHKFKFQTGQPAAALHSDATRAMSQQSPILVPDSDDDVSVASAGAVEARRLQEQFDAEARRARGDDEATRRLVARLAAPAVDDERSLRLARSLAAQPSEDASLRLARRLSGEPHNELKDVLGRALASNEFTVETSSLRGETVAALVGAGFDCNSGSLTLKDRSAAFALYSRLEAAPPPPISLGGRPLAAGNVLALDGPPAMAPGFDPTRPMIGANPCPREKVSSSLSTPSAPRRPAFDASEAKARRLKREAEHRREKAEKKKQRERLVSEFRDDRIYRGRNGARATGITDAERGPAWILGCLRFR